ncbi:MAG: ornithine cyclodeaminase family protein [Bacteroidia bacterium]|nr:MAG: ornithine cyclodeaminase family protein [Bacteroidia bacterium]
MKIIRRDQIERILPSLDLMPEIEQAFQAYSKGRAVVPPVGELLLDRGEVHIKYGYLKQQQHYVIKIASGFYEDQAMKQMSSNGMMLLFSQKSGQAVCALLDEGLLTNVRTAVAGAIAAKYLAPERVDKIGMVGAGTQARLQLSYLKPVTSCRKVMVWGTSREELESYRLDMEQEGFDIKSTMDIRELQQQCRLIVTTTPSKTPLLLSDYLQKGTHITAVGSDTPDKQELDPKILGKADLVVADSMEQCLLRGEIHQAIKAGLLEKHQMIELGHVISGQTLGRESMDQITVADLTGVAVQDLAIAEAVYKASQA